LSDFGRVQLLAGVEGVAHRAVQLLHQLVKLSLVGIFTGL
jgi:hypothetical protein